MRIILNPVLIISALHFCAVDGFTSVPNVEENSTNNIKARSHSNEIKPQPYMNLSSTSLRMSTDAEGKTDDVDGVKPLDVIQLNDEKIAEMIEVTFIKACLQLATGYVDVLKLFLAATNSAYDRKISLPDLIKSVNDCPLNTANRDLSPQEIEVRSTWMTVSYLTLEAIDRLEDTQDEDYLKSLDALDIPGDVRDTYGTTVEEIVRKEFGLGGESSSDADALSSSDPQTAALIAYNKKIISLTISNVKEARLANEAVIKEDDVGPPRPNIPGTY